MANPASPLFDSGFNQIATITFNGEAFVIAFERETAYGPNDHLVLGFLALAALVSRFDNDKSFQEETNV